MEREPEPEQGPERARQRAIVLGGGGVTGIAWEVGVLAGLHSAGVRLDADAVFGTSAGAFVAAALAGGAELEQLYAAQLAATTDEPAAVVSRKLLVAWTWAFIRGAGNPERVGAGFGAVAHRFAPLVTAEQRRRTVEARLTGAGWSPALRIAAIAAKTGRLHVFDATCGHDLVDVVSASGAVPGISPPVTFGGRQWIDGGMVSPANAGLAAGFGHTLVLAPLPAGHGGIPSAAQDVEALRRSGSAELIVPDPASVTAIGPNIYDPARRAAAATAGRAQGVAEGARIAVHWH